MKIAYRDIFLNLNLLRFDNPQNDLILFLHGFSGASKDWEGIADFIDKKFNLAAIDLIGHGETDSPDDLSYYNINFISGMIEAAIKYFCKDKVILCGYSMGGRAALNFTIHNPNLVEALILESSTAGILNESERRMRFQKDNELAQFILNHSVSEFVDYWMNLDLFDSQKKLDIITIDEIRKAKLKNNPIGLANSLIGFGTGAMPVLLNELKNLKIKTLLITGSLDTKFTEINKLMSELLPFSEHVTIEGTGHNTHLENPKKFCEELNSFLVKL
jgi:2-succinyl-6-hydroxy-2,4-cyclohexadiene-1-carboxylate synthase